MKQMSYAAAFADGLRQALATNDRASIIAGHLLGLGPHRLLMDAIYKDYHDRIFDPPNSEAAMAGFAAGAAMVGERPLVNLTLANFAYLAWSQIVNDAAVAHHMSNGLLTAPAIYYLLHGVRSGGAAQHCGSPQAMLWNSPGLEIVLPASPADVKGLLTSAFKSHNPIVFLTHGKLLGIEGPVPEGHYEVPFGRAEIKRPGRDVTIVATSYMVVMALEAAAILAKSGIEAEIVDPRTLVPLDEATILESVKRTGRLVVVDECPLRCGVAAEIAAVVAEKGFRSLKAPPLRLTRADVPMPFATQLEEALMPSADKLVAGVRNLLSAASSSA
jgi:pyruvate dehydrogenase E1 component beta subunit